MGSVQGVAHRVHVVRPRSGDLVHVVEAHPAALAVEAHVEVEGLDVPHVAEGVVAQAREHGAVVLVVVQDDGRDANGRDVLRQEGWCLEVPDVRVELRNACKQGRGAGT